MFSNSSKWILGIITAGIFTVISCGKDENDKPIDPIDESNCKEIRGTNGVFTLIPNLDFENWYSGNGAGGAEYKYENPGPDCFWATPNNGSGKLGGGGLAEVPLTVFKVGGDSAYSGNYAAMLKTSMGTLLGKPQLVAATVASGKFEVNITDPLNSLVFGQKFNKRPKTVTGYYMYYPVAGDSAGIYCFVTKNIPGSGGKVDTLGFSRKILYDEQSTYKKFELTLDYKNTDTPDNIVIYFASSENGDEFKGQPGNTLFIDEVKVEYHD